MAQYTGQGEKCIRQRIYVRVLGAIICLSIGWSAATSPFLTAPVFAADNFTRGCDLYNSGKYNQALVALQNAARQKPQYWAVHYYLGHTYLALGQHNLAISEYQTCQACRPPAQVQAACQRAIYDMRVLSGVRHGSARNTAAAAGHVASQDDIDRMHRIQATRDRILQQANDEAAKIRDETARANNDLLRNSNVRFINRGEIPAVDPAVTRELTERQDARIKAVYDRAQREIEALR